jgi:hypothetical protein
MILEYIEICLGDYLDGAKCDVQEKYFQNIEKKLERVNKCENVLFYGDIHFPRRNLIEIVRRAREFGFERIKLRTEASRLGQLDTVNDLIDAGCYLYEITLFDPKVERNECGTSCKLKVNETAKALKNFVRCSVSRGGVSQVFAAVDICLTSDNLSCLPEITSELEPLKPDRLILSARGENISWKRFLNIVSPVIERTVRNQLWIEIRGIPACILRELFYHWGEMYSGPDPELTYVRMQYCDECVLKTFCPGIASGICEFQSRQSGGPFDIKLGNQILNSVTSQDTITSF